MTIKTALIAKNNFSAADSLIITGEYSWVGAALKTYLVAVGKQVFALPLLNSIQSFPPLYTTFPQSYPMVFHRECGKLKKIIKNHPTLRS
jgi:hypothetical protein